MFCNNSLTYRRTLINQRTTTMDKITQDDIEGVLNSLMDSINEKDRRLFLAVAEHMPQFDVTDYETFHLKLRYTYKKFLRGVVRACISTNTDAEFIFLHSDYVDAQFRKIITAKEGGACSADKVRAIVRRLLQYYISGERIEWDWDAEYTYHYPKEIFQTHEDIVEFYEAAKLAYYGNPEAHATIAKYYEG